MKNLVIRENFSKDELYTLIKERINACKIVKWQNSDEDDYNHNTPYENATGIIKHGILSHDESYRLGLIKEKRDPKSNVNGNEYISVSKVESYDWERDFYYNYDYPTYINFVVDKAIKSVRRVMRNSEHYSNEQLIETSVPYEYLKCLQVRLLKLIKLISPGYYDVSLDKFVEDYNNLIECLGFMVENNLELPLVEASDETEMYALDKEKLLSYGKIVK